MKFTEQVKSLIANNEIKDESTNFLEDAVTAIFGDPVSVGKMINSIIKSPFFIREQLFWSKMESFLDGVFLHENDRVKISAIMAEEGDTAKNAVRIIDCIDRAESHQKIRYLINATRSLLLNYIDLPTFFRVCHAITYTLDEDLKFLRNQIVGSNIGYSLYVQGLLNSGLMYQSVIDGNGDQKYSFTPIAKLVDQFAVSYEDLERYPNAVTISETIYTIRTSIPALELKKITNDEIDEICDN